MSRLLRLDAGEAAASTGSFVVNHAPLNSFTPWARGDETDPLDMHDVAGDGPHIDDAEADAFTQGFEEGRRVTMLELAEEREALRSALSAIPELQPQSSTVLAAKLAATVERLVRDIVGRVEVDTDLLLARARAAAAIVIEQGDHPRLRANSDDAEFLSNANLPVEVFADPAMAHGSFVIETAHGWIEDGPEVRLQRLRDALDRLGMPQ